MLPIEHASCTTSTASMLVFMVFSFPHAHCRLYVTGFFTASLWILLTLALVVVSLLSSIGQVSIGGGALFTLQCDDYSPGLLWAVIVVHLVLLAYLVFWLGRGKACRGKKTNCAAASILFLLTILYGASIVGFSSSVLAFVNESRSTDDGAGDHPGNSSLGNMDMAGSGMNETDGGVTGTDSNVSDKVDDNMNGTVMNGTVVNGSGDMMNETTGTNNGTNVTVGGGDCERDMMSGSGNGGTEFNQTTCNDTAMDVEDLLPCVSDSSELFVLAGIFIGLLIMFMAALSCLLGNECSYNECCYQREFYDPTVTVMQNETKF